MKNMKYILLLLFMASFVTRINAQDHIVRGKVSDESGGIVGATIAELDANKRVVNGTITNVDGDYQIIVSSPDATIQYSFIGYKTIVEEVNGRATIDITLVPDAVEMEEFTVVGTASSRSITGISTRDQTGSSTIVQMDAVESNTVTSVGDALQGQVAGLDIVGGGSPGSGSSIVIRGLGSLGGSTPLVVVDGIIQRVNMADIDLASADQEDIGMLVSIAPEDIKSVRVLKDAAETAVYGTRGANGVLEIETFKGSRGKTVFDATYKKSLSFEPPRIPMLNGDEYVMLQQEMYHNRYGVIDLPPEISNDIEYLDYYNYAQNTEWVDDITRVGEIDDIGFKLSGGGDKTSYYASVNYQNNIGTVENEANKRFTTRINLGYNISTKLNLNTQISYVNIYKDGNWSREGNVRSAAYRKAPNMSIYAYTPDGVKTDEFFTPLENYQGNGVEYFNPSAVVAFSDNDQANNNFQTNFNLRYDANKWLTMSEIMSFQYQNSKRSEFLPYTAIGAAWLDSENNSALERNSIGTTVNSQTRINFNPISNSRHSLSGMLMLDITQDKDEYIQTASGSGPSTVITDPASSPMRAGLTSGSSVVNTIGVLANVHYKFLDRHIFQFNMRTDASSRFGASSRWGTFPSLSYAWRFSGEPFLDDWDFLNDSKFRVSYGLSGNSSVGAYDRHALYASTGKGAYMDIQSVIPTQAQLQRLQWETTAQLNVGFDIALFDYRVTLQAEYYDKITDNILWRNYKLPSSAGFTTLKQFNDGKIQNTGYEFTTRATVIKRKDLTLSLNFNIYFNENKFLNFPANIIDEKTDITNGQYPVKAEIGKPVGSFFGFRYLGVYPTTADAVAHNEDGSVKLDAYGTPIPMNYNGTYQFEGGDAIYQDINYDGRIDLNDVVYLGDSNPDFAGGFGCNLKYKGLQLNAQFLYRYGYKVVNQVAINAESMSNKDNQSKAVLNRWRVSGDDYPNLIPRAYQGHPANNLGSDRYVEDASFLRLNNVSLSYSFPTRMVRSLHLRNLRVGIQARKLLTFTNYTGQDPEVRVTQSDNALWFATDRGTVPPPIITAFNIAVGF
jgi:TonB-linked SusC/RagA family outer membrane protein